MGMKAPAHGCLHRGFEGHEIHQKHGDVQIRILRLIYGAGFAPAFSASYILRDVLPMLDRSSLDKLLNDDKRGELDAKIAHALEQQISEARASANGFAADHPI